MTRKGAVRGLERKGKRRRRQEVGVEKRKWKEKSRTDDRK